MAPLIPARVLVVEDDADTRNNLCDLLALDNYEGVPAATGKEALDRDDWPTFLAILLDWKLPDFDAETLLPELRRVAPEAAVIVLTGIGGLEGAVAAIRHGATDYITKPVDVDLLRASLQRVAQQRQLLADKARSEAAFRSLVEAASSLIVILDLKGRILYMNPAAERTTGHDLSEIRGMSCLEVCVPEERHAAVTEMLRNVVEEESCVEAEEPLQCRDGQRRWILWNIRRFEDYAEETVLLATGTDVTGRRLAEERLLQAERLAAIGNAMTGLAHESRNALQRAQANLELLALFLEDQPEAREIVTRLQATQSDLYRLYEEVRQYAAPLSLRPERISLQAVIQEAWDLLSAERQHRDAVLDCVLPMPGLECSGDRFQLLRVFRNLLENALAASPDPVHILASIEAVDQLGKPAVRVSIRDNGPGIPLDKQRRVFDEFFTTRQRGTGLGLAIVKRIIDAHGGDVRVNPDYHDGAEFQITLPIQSSPEAARELADDLY